MDMDCVAFTRLISPNSKSPNSIPFFSAPTSWLPTVGKKKKMEWKMKKKTRAKTTVEMDEEVAV